MSGHPVSGHPVSDECVVCLRPATRTHPVVGVLCPEHNTALTEGEAGGADPTQVVRAWRTAILAGALDYLETHTPPNPSDDEQGT